MNWSLANSELAHGWRSARPLLGTIVSIWASDQIDPALACDQSLLSQAVDAAFKEVQSVHTAMSFQDPQSELSMVNRLAAERRVQLSPPLHRVLRAALALAKASDGAFDPTVAAALVRSGHLPAPNDESAVGTASWRDVVLSSGGMVRFTRPLWLDLGGIAKGYAIDRAIDCLRRAGIRAATVNAGGDLRSFGHLHTVSVRDPALPGRSIPLLQARNLAVATSAGYFSRQRGRSALINPRTQRSSSRPDSVTVCAPRALWADALTKVVWFAEPQRAAALLTQLRASAMWLNPRGQRRAVA